jgi:FkbM family methyltransferase
MQDDIIVHQTDGTLVQATISGCIFRFFVKNRHDAIQRHHYVGEFYEREELAIITRYFKPGGVFVDIGANVGNHTLYAAKLLHARRVIPFEVNPEAIEILTANIALNDCSNVDTSYIGFGVASRDGPLISLPGPANNLGGQTYRMQDGDDQVLPAIRADAVLAHTPIDFIKLDIEGMEMEALAGLEETTTRWRPAIFAEIEDPELGIFNAWVLRHGYKLVDQFGRYENKVNYMIVAK